MRIPNRARLHWGLLGPADEGPAGGAGIGTRLERDHKRELG